MAEDRRTKTPGSKLCNVSAGPSSRVPGFETKFIENYIGIGPQSWQPALTNYYSFEATVKPARGQLSFQKDPVGKIATRQALNYLVYQHGATSTLTPIVPSSVAVFGPCRSCLCERSSRSVDGTRSALVISMTAGTTYVQTNVGVVDRV